MNKLLLVIPNRSQEERLEPLVSALSVIFKTEDCHLLFINESVNEHTDATFRYLGEKFSLPSHTIQKKQIINRKRTFLDAYSFAQDNHYDFLVFFNEGWEDNIFEFVNIIKNKEYDNNEMIIGKRTPKEANLGAFYDLFANLVLTKITKVKILENKCDSIFLMHIDNGFQLEDLTQSEDTFFTALILKMASKYKIRFTDVDFGINYKSFIKINTVRFFKIIFLAMTYQISQNPQQNS